MSDGESRVPEIVAESEGAPPARLLSFYDRLRDKATTAARRRGGKAGGATAEALLLIPDIFILLARLSLDSEVPKESRRLIGGALLYFILPVDLFPEVFAGPTGFLDDLVIACAVLGAAFSRDLESRTEHYWSGSRKLGSVLGDVSRTADALLGADLNGRVKQFLARRGIQLG
jgi:uncharacterized membrane protein YkvA (DUF1232 family)